MGRLLAVLPALLPAAAPLLSFIKENETELPLSVIWWPLALTGLCVVVLYGILALVTRSAAKAGALVALSVVWFFHYDTFKGDIDGLGLSGGAVLAVWTALFIVVVVTIVRARRPPGVVLIGLGVAAAVIAVPPAISVAKFQHDHPAVKAAHPGLWASALPPPPRPARRPDIYVLIPDDAARADVLAQYFHYDNSPFRRALEQRGFSVFPNAVSPYSDSESNIAAELNLDYLDGLPKILGPKSEDVRPLKWLMEDPRAARIARPLGYRFVHLDSDEVTWAADNPDTSWVATPETFGSFWMMKTVLREFGGPIGFSDNAANARYRKTVLESFARLRDAAKQPGPKLVVFHTLIPHDPYVFGARGEAVTYPVNTDEAIHSKMALDYYVAQLKFTETKLLEAVDAIQAASKTPPAMVIQADEGYEAGEDVFGVVPMQHMRVKELAAVALPTRKAREPKEPSTVNTLRYVFNEVLGSNYPMLPTHSHPEGDHAYQWPPMPQ